MSKVATEVKQEKEAEKPPPPKPPVESKPKQPSALMKRLKYWNQKLVFDPERPVRAFWDLFVLIFIVYNYVVIPLRIGFMWYEIPQWIGSDLLADFVLWVDILFNFRTAFSLYGQQVTLQKKMAVNYLKNNFLLDILAQIPFDVIGYGVGYYPWFRLNRFLRLSRFNYYFDAAQILVPKFPIIFRLAKVVAYTALASHISGCAYMFVNLVQPVATLSFQVGSMDVTTSGRFVQKYIRIIFWGFGQLTGYANTMPQTDLETALMLIVTCIGLALYVTIVGTVGSILSQVDASGAEFERHMENLRSFMDYRKLPSAMKRDILTYYNYIWNTRKSLNEEGILDDLPIHLKTEVSLFLNKEILSKVDFFAKLEQQFLNSIVLKLKPRVALPKSFIVKKGDIGREMFFVNKGTVEVVTEPDPVTGERKVIVELGEGKFFGELALINNDKRMASIRAKDFCDLFIFTKSDFQQALQSFPDEVREQILEVARNRMKKK